MFAHPVGVLVFNRPEYAKSTLESIARQTLKVDEARLTIVRDGYHESKDQHLGRVDKTREVDELVATYFPSATYIRHDTNVGVALAYEELYERVFAGDDKWGVFFEEDFVLDEDYLEVLSHMMETFDTVDRVATVSAIGDVSVPRDRGLDALYPDRHLWAYAMKRSFWIDSSAMRKRYLSLMENTTYWDRDTRLITREMANEGLLLPGTSQDYVKFAIMRASSLLALSTGASHGSYIGEEGLHFTPEHFRASGYAQVRTRVPRGDAPPVPHVSDEMLVSLETESRVLWAHEMLRQVDVRDLRLARLDSKLRRARAKADFLSRQVSVLKSGEPPESVQQPALLGAWTWFGGPSALSIGNVTLLGLVRRRGFNVTGESHLAVFDERGRHVRNIPLLSDLELDDHNVPTVVALDEKRFVVGVTGHNQTNFVRLAVGTVLDNDVRLGERVDVDFGHPTTYVHFVPETDETLLVLTRCARESTQARRLNLRTLLPISEVIEVFPWKIKTDSELVSGRDGNRPYLITRITSDGVIFALTHDHPRAYRNGIVAGRFRGADIFDLSGNLVHHLGDENENWDPFGQLTQIVESGKSEIPWIHDVVDFEDSVTVAFSCAPMPRRNFMLGRDQRHVDLRYRVARWTASEGVSIIHDLDAGHSLYEAEQHYSGGIALNPRNPDHIVYSTSRLPIAGRVQPVGTSNQPVWSLLSKERNATGSQTRVLSLGSPRESVIRPVFSASGSHVSHHALFAMSGAYETYSDFDTTVRSFWFAEGSHCHEVGNRHLDLPYPLSLSPAMPEAEARFLARAFAKAKNYLEYGAGWSTLAALHRGVPMVVSVEPDAALAEILRALAVDIAATSKRSSVFECVTPPQDLLFGWGNVDATDDVAKIGFAYVEAGHALSSPDLVLVDGRFRVACALDAASRISPGGRLLIDDYAERPSYHVVEEFFGVPRLHGRLAEFRLARPVDVPRDLRNHAMADSS